MDEKILESEVSIGALAAYGAISKKRALEFTDDDQELYDLHEERWLAAETIIAHFAFGGDRLKARDLIDEFTKDDSELQI